MLPRMLLLLLIMVAPALAAAQSLRLDLGGGPAGAELLLGFTDQPVAGGRFGAAIHFRGVPGMALSFRNTTTWGPVGNLIIDLDASLAPYGAAFSAQGRGVIGNVSLRTRASWLHGETPPRLRDADAAFPPPPRAGGSWLAAFEAGATYRVSRDLLVLADLAWLWAQDGTGLRGGVEMRMPRLVGGHELRLAVETLAAFGAGGSLADWVSLGAGLHIDRQRAAPWTVWFLLGGGEDGFSPGFRLAVSERTGRGNLQAELRLEPWRSDVPPLVLAATWSVPLAGGATLAAVVEAAAAPAELRAVLRYAMPLN